MRASFSFRSAIAAVSLSAALLAGCASTGESAIEGVKIDDAQLARDLSALMEAPDRMQLTCTSIEPLSTKTALHDIVFSCPKLQLEATLIEMRDAGWRLMSIDVGTESRDQTGLLSMPLTVELIKLL